MVFNCVRNRHIQESEGEETKLYSMSEKKDLILIGRYLSYIIKQGNKTNGNHRWKNAIDKTINLKCILIQTYLSRFSP